MEEKDLEQSQAVQPSQEENSLDSISEQLGDDVTTTVEAERGSPIGRFKNVDELVKAYNNLQAEFTRKSQKLADLEASMTTNDKEIDGALQDFLSKNREAVAFANELKEHVKQSDSQDENAFDKAWAEILYNKLSHSSNSKEFQKLVLKDDELQNLVIKNYMKQLQGQKIPIVMSSNSGDRVTKAVTPNPDSFEEAKKIVLDLLS